MTTEPHQPSMATIQANIARIAKNSQNKRPRDWMLYVFFRVMKQSEVDLTKALLLNLIKSLAEKSDEQHSAQAVGASFGSPATMDLDTGELGDELHTNEDIRNATRPHIDFEDKVPDPAKAFFSWLK